MTDLQRHLDVVQARSQSGSVRTIQRYLSSTEEILAATAHELRLPVSHIKGFVSSLRRTDVTWDDQTRSEFLADIEIETDRLAQLLVSLLTSRARNGTVELVPQIELTTPASVIKGGLHPIRGF